jgi:hypothetical protein
MTAVDVVVTGLQKHLISAKVLRVGIQEFPGSGIVDKVMKPESRLVFEGWRQEQADATNVTQHKNGKKLSKNRDS